MGIHSVHPEHSRWQAPKHLGRRRTCLRSRSSVNHRVKSEIRRALVCPSVCPAGSREFSVPRQGQGQTCSFSPSKKLHSIPCTHKRQSCLSFGTSCSGDRPDATGAVKSEGPHCETNGRAHMCRLIHAAVVLEAFNSMSELPGRCHRSLCLGSLLMSRLTGIGRQIPDDPYFQFAIAGL